MVMGGRQRCGRQSSPGAAGSVDGTGLTKCGQQARVCRQEKGVCMVCACPPSPRQGDLRFHTHATTVLTPPKTCHRARPTLMSNGAPSLEKKSCGFSFCGKQGAGKIGNQPTGHDIQEQTPTACWCLSAACSACAQTVRCLLLGVLIVSPPLSMWLRQGRGAPSMLYPRAGLCCRRHAWLEGCTTAWLRISQGSREMAVGLALPCCAGALGWDDRSGRRPNPGPCLRGPGPCLRGPGPCLRGPLALSCERVLGTECEGYNAACRPVQRPQAQPAARTEGGAHLQELGVEAA